MDSFLNLAKALCEIKYPRFHKKQECYRHGVAWNPSTEYLVDAETDQVKLTARGVWHTLWEAITNTECKTLNPTKISIKKIFSLCPEVSADFEKSFCSRQGYVSLIQPRVLEDKEKKEVWLSFSINKFEVKYAGMTIPKLLDILCNRYKRVSSNNGESLAFELKNAKKYTNISEGQQINVLKDELEKLNLYVSLVSQKHEYHLPVIKDLPIKMPQLITLYTIMFWLGSIVRYDPHSVVNLEDSEYWIVIDAFMTQSRIWLLELFEWELYKRQTLWYCMR